MKNAIPKLNFIDREQVEEIHEASVALLAETGIMIDSEKVYQTLKAEGIDVQVQGQRRGKTFWRVRLGRDVTGKALETAPKTITLAGRTPNYDLHLNGKGGDDSIFFGTLGSAPMVRDLESGERRPATIKDLVHFARLADALSGIDYFHVMVMPNDVAKPVLDLYRWKTTFENTSKHAITAAVYDVRNIPFLFEMAAAVAGGKEELRRRPIFSATECPVSPFYFGERSIENIVELAKAKLPVIIYSEPFAGASSPVTLAGSLLITNAEALAGVTLTQIVSPGCPVIYGSVATVMDLRTGSIAFGAAETGLFNMATTAMARFYSLPNLTAGGRTDSKLPDCQSGFEKQSNILLAAMSGANLSSWAGALESNYTVCYSQLVIDDEIIQRTKRFLRGFSFDKERVATELIKQIGPAGQYLGNKHTLKYMREEIYSPHVSSRGSYEDWKSKGGLDLEQAGRERAKEILGADKGELLEEKKLKEIEKIIFEAEKMHQIRK